MSIINSVSNQTLTSTSTPTFNNVTASLSVTSTSGATTTLTSSSTNGQLFIGSSTQTVVMPVVSTLSRGTSYRIINKSSGNVTVQSSGGNTIQVMATNTSLLLICISTSGTDETSWQALYVPTSPFTFPLAPSLGGTGVANNDSNTLTVSGVSSINQNVTTTGTPSFTSATMGNINVASNTISSTNSNGAINIVPNGSGITLVGGSTSAVSSALSNFQVIKASGNAGIAIAEYNNNQPTLGLYRSAASGPGSFSAVTTGSAVGSISFFGDDGSAFQQACAITGTATGTISSGIVPGLMTFFTTNSSGVSTQAMQISSAQVLTLANPLPVGSGGTGLTSYTANNLIYASGTSTLAGLATANNGLLVTNGSGVPSIGNSIGASISITGAVTATTGVNTGVSGTSSATNTINTFNVNGTAYTITKSGAGTTAVTFLQITIPAGLYFVGIECFIINSRVPSSNAGTSFVEKRYFSIARNGSGSDVVLDSAAGADFTSTTTTAGGALSAISGVTTIARNGAESNTSPQVVNLTINPQTTAISTGSYVAQCNILMLGSQTGFSIS